MALLLIPCESREDCMIDEFFIPNSSKVIVNAWAIMRDRSAWDDVEKFWSERFEGRNIYMKGHEF